MPSPQALYADKLLAELAVGYSSPQFIGSRMLPVVYSPNQTGKYITFDDEEFVLQIDDASPYSDIQATDYSASQSSYNAEGHALEHFVPNLIDEDPGIDALEAGTKVVMGKLLRRREKAVYDTALAAVSASTVTGSWDTATDTGATVVKDIETMRGDVEDATGATPNVLVVGTDVFKALKKNFYGKFINPTAVTTEEMASILDVEEVLVARVTTKPAAGGTAAKLWTAKTALLYHRGDATQSASNAGTLVSNIAAPSFGKLVYWRSANSVDGVEVFRIPDPRKGTHGGVWVRGVVYYDPVITLAGAGRKATVLA